MVKEKVVNFMEVERSKVPIGEKTWFRPLIGKDDGAPNYAMRMFEVEKGGYIEAHQHPWEHEIFILEGHGEVKIGDNVYRVKAGDAIFIPPNIVHAYKNIGDKTLRFICVIPHPPQ